MAGMQLLVVADTHVPVRARDLPDQLWRQVDRADVVVRAGDRVQAGLRLPNPGAPTGRRRQPHAPI